MSGVKNLRAMFEQKNDTSPPDRGRSPGPGTPSFGSPTPSSRPLSKVRTNFIAVEKNGRVGLARDPSRDSVSVSSRRLSDETESTTPAPITEMNDPFTDNMAENAASFKSNFVNDPIPESPAQSSPGKTSPFKGTETPEITPCPNPDKIVDEEESKTKLTPADPTIKSDGNGTSNSLNGSSESQNKGRNTTATTKSTLKPAAPITTSAKTTSKPLKSPLPTKTPKSPVKETPSTKAPERKPATTAAKVTPPKTAAPRSRSIASSDKKSGALDMSPSTGFVKPKPKSPTRPVQLPSRLTAPTAASASKLGSSALPRGQSQTRASGTTSTPATTQRPASRVSTATAGTAASSGKTLKRQASTVGRPRPSLGPPPKLPAKDHPPTRKESHQVDEGFLARMMRPTASSSSKTSDKTPVTPPRKHAAPAAARKTIDKSAEGSAKKASAKIAESIKKDSSVKKPAVAKTEVKKAAPSKTIKSAEPTVKEVASVTAQAEIAEAAIEAANTSEETTVKPAVVHQDTEKVARSTTPEGEPKSSTQPVPEAEERRPAAAPANEEPLTAQESVEKTGAIASKGKEDSLFDAETVPSNTNTVGSSSQEEAKAENVPDIEHDKQITSMDKDAKPTIAADPGKVEDIEDVVHETLEHPVEKAE